ncbi:MAG: transposase domain-containing protein [Lachnospiraceae bacterium]
MATNYTEEQLDSFSKEILIQLFLFLSQQVQLEEIGRKLQLVLEQVAVLNRNRFGRSHERMDTAEQISFLEIDGEIVFFNEVEALASLDEEDEEPEKERPKKSKGKRAADLSSLPTVIVEHEMSSEELNTAFGGTGNKRLPDEVYYRYRFTPAKVHLDETNRSFLEDMLPWSPNLPEKLKNKDGPLFRVA